MLQKELLYLHSHILYYPKLKLAFVKSIFFYLYIYFYLFSFLLTINLKLIIVHVEIKIVNN